MAPNPELPVAASGRGISIAALQRAYREGRLTPGRCAERVLQRLEQADDNPIWITRVAAPALLQRAAACDRLLAERGPAILDEQPLFGVPYAVKDNIDVAQLPTTAACPAFAYTPTTSAAAVRQVEAAGALLIGKTNLDQFATGLVGARSPYGVVRHPWVPDRVAGGSSAGSAVAVALGFVAFALGTDTAGSGRVPAGFNGIVGLKPSRGLVSTRGMLPACRSLDCISVFGGDVEDAWRVLGTLAGYDACDPFSRALTQRAVTAGPVRLGLPAHCEFYGDAQAQAAFEAALRALDALPWVSLQPRDTAEVFAAAELLYDGPWIAERRAALGPFFDRHAGDIEPSVREIIALADRFSAVDAFEGFYRLQRHRRAAQRLFAEVDALLVPTAPTHPLIADVQREPIAVNSRLGHYTNFANLLDLAAIAIPAAPRGDGLPAGITLLAPAGSDHRLATIALRFAAVFGASPAAQALPPLSGTPLETAAQPAA